MAKNTPSPKPEKTDEPETNLRQSDQPENEFDQPENENATGEEADVVGSEEIAIQDDSEDVDENSELAELKDRLLREVADKENMRRRLEREKTDMSNYAVTAFARDLLGVSDNLRRALDSVPKDTALDDIAKNLYDGIEITERELLKVLERHHIKKIDPMGKKFDHNYHQALLEVEDSEQEDGTIVQVMQSGYLIKDRLLRPAMVGIARQKKTEAARVDQKI